MPNIQHHFACPSSPRYGQTSYQALHACAARELLLLFRNKTLIFVKLAQVRKTEEASGMCVAFVHACKRTIMRTYIHIHMQHIAGTVSYTLKALRYPAKAACKLGGLQRLGS